MNPGVIDRDARDVLAEQLRHLISCQITNDEFERAIRRSRFGGSSGPFTTSAATALVEEWNPATSQWIVKAPLANARLYQNAVILPDRRILIVGGSSVDDQNTGGPITPITQPEIYDPMGGPVPGSGSTCLATIETTPRVYHSVACLLMDGRVLMCGGQDTNPALPSKDTGVVYTPPYHLMGPIPTVISAPANIGYAPSTFNVTVQWSSPALPAQYRIVLIRPGSVTHHFDNEQRYIELRPMGAVQQGNQWVITVASPADVTLAPQGYYMLWAVENKQGFWIPSKSAAVHAP